MALLFFRIFRLGFVFVLVILDCWFFEVCFLNFEYFQLSNFYVFVSYHEGFMRWRKMSVLCTIGLWVSADILLGFFFEKSDRKLLLLLLLLFVMNCKFYTLWISLVFSLMLYVVFLGVMSKSYFKQEHDLGM